VVAGAASGIGAATAQRLGEEGAKVIAGDIVLEGVRAVATSIAAAGGTAKAVAFDLANEDACNALIKACVDSYGGIDGLVNVAAELPKPDLAHDGDLLQVSEENWTRYLDVNVVGYKRTIRAALPHMIAQRNGAITNVSSSAAFLGEDVRSAYAASKVAGHAIVRHVARRWGRDNVRCNAVAPGPVLSEQFVKFMPKDELEQILQSVAMGRSGKPSEIASLIAFLQSDDAAWVTGQVWGVNGGQLMRD
jgi:NAD(P)-dependent dehydrogenase (short-subunit alcohol dehydrogenase family)